MILVDENKLTLQTIAMIGEDLGIEGYDPNKWMVDIKTYDEYVDKVVDYLYVGEEGETA